MSATAKRLLREAACFSNAPGLWWQRVRRRPTRWFRERSSGLVFECMPEAESMALEVFSHRLYDIPSCPVRPGDRVVDIGANHGFATCLFARQGAHVLAFEPNPRTTPLLRANVDRNGLARQVTIRAEAVHDRSEVLTLEHSLAWGGGIGSVVPGFVAGAGGAVAETFQVPAGTLAEALAEEGWIGRIRLVKIDAEGSEQRILDSLPGDLVGRIDSLAIEFHGSRATADELTGTIRRWALGFEVQAIGHWNILHAVREPALADSPSALKESRMSRGIHAFDKAERS